MQETWETPAITEIRMDAEIGAYQEDGAGDGNTPIAEADADPR